MKHIVFLCTGNTCRSPMAEGMFNALANGQYRASSAGLYTVSGMPPSDFAVQAAAKYGADISGHTSRMLTKEIAEKAEYLICMTAAHYDRMMELYPMFRKKIYTISGEDIPDPFGCSLERYEQCAAQLYDAVKQVLKNIRKEDETL